MRTLNKFKLLALGLIASSPLMAQNEFYNDGADVYVQAAGLIYVQGDVINDDQGVNVGRIHNSGDIQLTGNWSNTSAVSNVFDMFAPGTTTFLGTGAVQTIGGTKETGFNNLTINKSGGTTQEVRQLINSGNDGILNLTNDFLNTQTFTFGVGNINPSAITRTGAIVPNYLSSMTQGYVTSTPGSAGRLIRATDGTTFPGIAYLFPVGNGTRFRPVEVTPAVGSGVNAYMVQFVNLPTPNTNLKSPTLSTINPAWYHFIERQNLATNAENVRIYHDFAADNVCDINMVTMAEWNSALWFDLSPTGSLNPAGFLSWTQKNPYPGAYPTPWSPFPPTPFALAGLFLASGAMSCVFPVVLTDLYATPTDNSINVNWVAQSQTNNAGWYVERSLNGHDFEDLGFVQGAGTQGSPMNYDFDDVNVMRGVLYYYRLRQLDLNGDESQSEIVTAILPGDQINIGDPYPNPSNGTINLPIATDEAGKLKISITNMLGQEVVGRNYDLENGFQILTLDLSSLAKGVYQVNFQMKGTKVAKKLVLE